MSAAPIIQIRDMKVAYGRNVVLDGFSLDIPKGQVMGIIGPSGGGKSVTLRAVVGLKQPESGSVEVFGEQLELLSSEERTAIERRWGIMFQDGALFSNLTVRENVMVPMREHTDLNPALRHALADMKIRMAGLSPSAGDKYPSDLSGGMRKRAALARALALDPELLFLDEPTAGVDVELRRDMWALVRGLRDKGVTVILTTHYIDEAEEMADRIGVILNGELILVEDKNALMKKLGRKQLTLHLQEPMAEIPAALAQWRLTLKSGGNMLEYGFDASDESTGIPALLRQMHELGIGFKDLHTEQSSLEDIFVSLVGRDSEPARRAAGARA